MRTVIVLDGDRPLGVQWIANIRKWCHMPEGNTRHFGQRPYYYACHDHNRVGHEIQYLVLTQGKPDPAARWRIALAMLRQWCAQCVPRHNLGLIDPKYFIEDEASILLTQGPSA